MSGEGIYYYTITKNIILYISTIFPLYFHDSVIQINHVLEGGVYGV